MRSLQIRARAKGQRFQIVETGVNGLVVQRALNIIIIGHGFEPEELAESGKRLDFREPGCKHVRLELQQLQFDFEQVSFAHGAGFKAGLTDIKRLLKAVEFSWARSRVDCASKTLTNCWERLKVSWRSLSVT